MSGWRFRTTWRGKVVLQRHVGSDGPAQEWVDAKATDLLDFARELQYGRQDPGVKL